MQNLTGYIFLLLAVVLTVMLMSKKKATTVDSETAGIVSTPVVAANPFDAWYAANLAPKHGAYSTVS